MKNYQIILAIATIFVLVAIDNHAAGMLPDYGHALRAVVWLIIASNIVIVYEGVRAHLPESDFE